MFCKINACYHNIRPWEILAEIKYFGRKKKLLAAIKMLQDEGITKAEKNIFTGGEYSRDLNLIFSENGHDERSRGGLKPFISHHAVASGRPFSPAVPGLCLPC